MTREEIVQTNQAISDLQREIRGYQLQVDNIDSTVGRLNVNFEDHTLGHLHWENLLKHMKGPADLVNIEEFRQVLSQYKDSKDRLDSITIEINQKRAKRKQLSDGINAMQDRLGVLNQQLTHTAEIFQFPTIQHG